MKKVTAIICIFAIALFSYVASSLYLLTTEDKVEEKPVEKSEIAERTENSGEKPYTVRENGGKIIIEHDGLVTVTDIPVSSMREADRERFEEGITASTREEVLMLLEDFES